MAARPALRLFTAEGMYDLATPASASGLAFKSAGVKEGRRNIEHVSTGTE